MEVFSSPTAFFGHFSSRYWGKNTLGFVPTMGALHEGHASLARRSVNENELTVVSIFVNPTQFGPQEDLGKYPRTPEQDLEMLEKAGVNAVFMPTPADMYPFGEDEVRLKLTQMDKVLCGASRPGHFNGVVQVVNKLLNIVRPGKAYFGLKDFQQWTIIRRMSEEFFLPVEIVGCPTVRESDGLAMSSRNRYMSAGEREQAVYLSKALNYLRENAREGMEAAELLAGAEKIRAQYPLIRPDYFEIRREKDLGAVSTLRKAEHPRGFIAAWCGAPRLIDNMSLFD